MFIQGNQLATIDLQYNSLLYELGCDNNPLTTLDLSNNTEIQKLFCSHTEISSIIFPNDCKIYRLSCESANLTEIDVSALQDLDFLSVWNNDITTLDVSNNLLLTELLCGQNQLESLLIPESNIINKIDARNNRLSNLEEILNVDTGSNTINEQNPSLITLNILRNNFVFADFEPRWVELTQIPAFSYDAQNMIGVQAEISIELGTELTLEIAGYLPATSDQYQWHNNLEILDGETGTTLELGSVDFAHSGAYHCEVTNTAVPDLTLESFTIQVLVTTVGTEDFEKTALNVYPNPASDFISIQNEGNEIHFQLFNSEGKKIFEDQSFSGEEINVDHLPKGLYILKVDAIGSRATKRVILY